MRSLLLVLAAVLVAACAPSDERALADHLAQVTEAGSSACAQLDWPATRSVVASLPESDRVVTVAHDEELAVCAFGDVTQERRAEEAEAAARDEAAETAARDGGAGASDGTPPVGGEPDRTGWHPAAVVAVMADPPELDAHEGTTMGGREVEHGGWEPIHLGLHEDPRGVVKTLRVGDHALIATVASPNATDPTAGELLDAAAADLGL
jgi:hypothetical protein